MDEELAPPVYKTPLYEQLAVEMAGQIERGTYRPGERIPSVRQASQERSLSITTVLQAYQMLEDRGYIEARPQSGYYVLPRPAAVAPEPGVSTASLDPSEVSIEELAIMVLRDTLNPDLVQFGAAIPDPELLPTGRLNRILASLIRNEEVPLHVSGVPEGYDELRIQVAQRAFHAGCSLSPAEIMITTGCTEALNLALRAVCKPGDLVAIESPSYFGILQILESQGLRALEIPTHHRDGISLEALRFALEHHQVSACITVSNFSNPLGSCMPDENKKELVELLAEREIPLIEDDIHGELYFSGQRPRVAKAYDREGLVLLCSSFSKDISPAYRVGWIAPGRFQGRFERLKMATNVGTPIITQLAIARFLKSGGYDHHLRRIRRAYAGKVAAMAQAVLRHFPSGTRVTSPAGGFLLWVQLPEGSDSLVLYRQALKSGITIAPGDLFSSTSAKYSNYIRLNAAYMSEATLPALQRLGELAGRL
jgi:DNA-binding transcriptional MocR family regulator